MKAKKLCFLFFFFLATTPVFCEIKGMLSGRVVTRSNEAVTFATAHLKGSGRGGQTDKEGIFRIKAPVGKYTLIVLSLIHI